MEKAKRIRRLFNGPWLIREIMSEDLLKIRKIGKNMDEKMSDKV